MGYKIKKPIRLIELFAGIGSQAKALENLNADFEHYKVIEFDKNAVNSYNAIHDTNFEPSDITKIKGSDLEIKDTEKYEYIMTYSFPCQDLSVVGKQKGMDKGSNTRSGLLWEVERLLNETQELPQVLLLENVIQVHGTKNKKNFDDWLNFLESKGYSNYWKDLNSKDYDVPQNRKRCFVISILKTNEPYEFPKKTEPTRTAMEMLEMGIDEKFYITERGLKIIANTKFKIERYVEDTKNMANGKCNHYFAICDYRYDEGIRIRKNELMPTLTTKSTSSLSGNPLIWRNLRLRYLTPKERYRFMGFDDKDYYKISNINTMANTNKQVGNSIVVNVLESIFKQLL